MARSKNPNPPSHVTRAQAARILRISPQSIQHHARLGGRLEPEHWYGTPMIPMWRIIEFADRTNQQGHIDRTAAAVGVFIVIAGLLTIAGYVMAGGAL